MVIEVKNRSKEAWGPLAADVCSDMLFKQILNSHPGETKDTIKNHIKREKKLKTYKVNFVKELISETIEIRAESEYDVSSAARAYFKENKDSIEFKMKAIGKWAGDYEGYDRLRYVKVRS